MKVLAFGKRNGLENVILDPLLIACLIVRDMPVHLSDLCLPEAASLRALADAKFADAPRLAQLVQDLVLGVGASDESVECVYQGGLVLDLRRTYLEHDDHGLEEKIRIAFPSLKEVKARAGTLGLKMAKGVLTDYPELIPREIEDVFREILQA